MGGIENRLWMPLKVKAMKAYKKILLALVLISCSFLMACDGRHYVGQHFYFPQNSNPDELNWKYHGYIHMSLAGNWFDLNEKNIKVSIFSSLGKEIVIDEFDLTARGLRVETIWDDENSLTVNFIEVEDPFLSGSYKSNSDLAPGKPIRKLFYNPRKFFENPGKHPSQPEGTAPP